MGRLRVRCERCGAGFVLRDNGFEDPAVVAWCPRCGSKNIERRDVPALGDQREAAA